MPQEIAELQRNLVRIARKTRREKKRIAAIKREYVPYVKNPLMGYAELFGKNNLRDLGYSREGVNELYRRLHFQDIKYRSKLRKIRDRISELDSEYNRTLNTLRTSIPRAA